MSDFLQHERDEIHALLDEGLLRLNDIEDDIRTIVSRRDDPNPIVQMSVAALDRVDPDAQIDLINRSRTMIQRVKTKLASDDFSETDTDEVLNLVENLSALGRLLAAASKQYRAHIHQRIEGN